MVLGFGLAGLEPPLAVGKYRNPEIVRRAITDATAKIRRFTVPRMGLELDPL
jgi:hypothetical protein